MKKTILSTLGAVALACLWQSSAQAQMLLISEVYGGGGNANTTYKNDFIELYNYGTTVIDMSTLAVYYAATTANAFNTTNFTALNGTLAPASYYLIQERAGGAGTTNLPTPNATGNIDISSTGGKVAIGLASTVPTFSTGNVNGNTTAIDFLGWGSSNAYEGAGGAAAATTSTTSIARTSVLADANSNSTEFAVGAPTPVPEPSAYAVLAMGLLALFGVQRVRRSKAQAS